MRIVGRIVVASLRIARIVVVSLLLACAASGAAYGSAISSSNYYDDGSKFGPKCLALDVKVTKGVCLETYNDAVRGGGGVTQHFKGSFCMPYANATLANEELQKMLDAITEEACTTTTEGVCASVGGTAKTTYYKEKSDFCDRFLGWRTCTSDAGCTAGTGLTAWGDPHPVDPSCSDYFDRPCDGIARDGIAMLDAVKLDTAVKAAHADKKCTGDVTVKKKVLCPGMDDRDYCDCTGDCGGNYCKCDAAVKCCTESDDAGNASTNSAPMPSCAPTTRLLLLSLVATFAMSTVGKV